MSENSSTPAKADRSPTGGGDLGAPGQGGQRFTHEALARFDGTDPRLPILIAYRGRVYDVTDSFMWMRGRHFWLKAGRDLTERLQTAPHGEEVFERVRCIGILESQPNLPRDA
jgi:predicted heme/steroid binding protein